MGLTIYTGGTFDLFHSGHVRFLKRCAELGDVVVSLNTDEFITKYKGKPPVIAYRDRRDVIASCKYVSEVIPNTGGADSKPAILAVMPDLIAIGSDWARRDYYAQMNFNQDFLDSHGIGMVYLPYSPDISSTDIKKRLQGQQLK